MTDSIQAKNYAESRTGRGDKWFEQIKTLKTQVDEIALYADAHRAFRMMIEESLTTLSLDNSREIARNEIVEFCNKRIKIAQDVIKVKLARITNLENNGVE